MEPLFDVLVTIGALAIIAATLLSILRNDSWWVRCFDFPRVQIAVIGASILAIEVFFRTEAGTIGNVVRAALGLCILYQAYRIRPYTLLARRQVKPAERPRPESTLSLLLANVKMENRNSARLKQFIVDTAPDVLLIVEADDWWQNELRGCEETHPYTVQQPQDNTYGMLLYSRMELLRPEIRFLVEDDVPSIRASVRLPAGIEVEIHCLHPKPPVPQETAQSTERDAELTLVGREVKEKKLPVIVMGDLNDVAWSRTTSLFQRISGMVDPRIGRGFYNSFHARYFFLRFPLDHFFHSTHFRLMDLKRLPYFGSDHFPMSIRLSHEPEARREQEAPDSDASDEARATEKIAAAKQA